MSMSSLFWIVPIVLIPIGYIIYRIREDDGAIDKFFEEVGGSWEHGTCWTPVRPDLSHKVPRPARRNKRTGEVQYFIENSYDKDGGRWVDFGETWWKNFKLKD